MKFLIILFFIPISVFAQNLDLSPYKYAYIAPLNQQDIDDAYGVTSSLASSFSSLGLIIVNNYTEANVPTELRNNPCLMITVTPRYSEGMSTARVKMDISNCKNEKLFSKDFSGTALLTTDDVYGKLLKKMSKEIDGFKFKFDPNKIIPFEISIDPNYTLKNSGLTEDSIKSYLDTKKIEPIEGIYKTIDTDNSNNYYKLGIIKISNDTYQVIILESGISSWKVGEIKGIIENTAVQDLYSVQFYSATKSKIETFASRDEAVIKIDLSKLASSKDDLKNSNLTLLKTYPTHTSVSKPSISSESSPDLISTATGFLISENGLIVTNYHVIEKGSKYIISHPKQPDNKIELELIQKDKMNDLAILKIKNITNLTLKVPYKLSNKSAVGENVFTIGYPLGVVMGESQKVTNGIINSLSGVQDDTRYYQISTPIQPGNSGGPLFDLKGNVIGITSATLNAKAVNSNVQNVNYAIKINMLQNLLSLTQDGNDIKIENSSNNVEFPISLLSEKYKNCVFLIEVFR